IDKCSLRAQINRHEREKHSILDREILDIWPAIFERFINGAIFTHISHHVLSNIPSADSLARRTRQKDLNGFGYLEPRLSMLETERRHRIISDAGGEYSQRAIDGSMRV